MDRFLMTGPKAARNVGTVLFVLAATVGFAPEASPALQSTAQLGLPSGTQFRVVPTPDSQFRDADVFVSLSPDGAVQVHTSPNRPDVPIGRRSLYFAVDIQNRVYRAAVMTKSAAVNALRMTQIIDAFGRADDIDPVAIRAQAQARADFLNQYQISLVEMWLPPCQECDVDNCFGFADSWLETFDPPPPGPHAKLNETSSLVSWEAQDTGTKCIWEIDVSPPTCWAANPSSEGTHWYVLDCVAEVEDEYFYGGATRVLGIYQNYDFADPEEPTWTEGEIATYIDQDTAVDIDWMWRNYGEYYWLLHAHWDEDWANGCWLPSGPSGD